MADLVDRLLGQTGLHIGTSRDTREDAAPQAARDHGQRVPGRSGVTFDYEGLNLRPRPSGRLAMQSTPSLPEQPRASPSTAATSTLPFSRSSASLSLATSRSSTAHRPFQWRSRSRRHQPTGSSTHGRLASPAASSGRASSATSPSSSDSQPGHEHTGYLTGNAADVPYGPVWARRAASMEGRSA